MISLLITILHLEDCQRFISWFPAERAIGLPLLLFHSCTMELNWFRRRPFYIVLVIPNFGMSLLRLRYLDIISLASDSFGEASLNQQLLRQLWHDRFVDPHRRSPRLCMFSLIQLIISWCFSFFKSRSSFCWRCKAKTSHPTVKTSESHDSTSLNPTSWTQHQLILYRMFLISTFFIQPVSKRLCKHCIRTHGFLLWPF